MHSGSLLLSGRHGRLGAPIRYLPAHCPSLGAHVVAAGMYIPTRLCTILVPDVQQVILPPTFRVDLDNSQILQSHLNAAYVALAVFL